MSPAWKKTTSSSGAAPVRPAQLFVEAARPPEVAHAEGDQADALLHRSAQAAAPGGGGSPAGGSGACGSWGSGGGIWSDGAGGAGSPSSRVGLGLPDLVQLETWM